MSRACNEAYFACNSPYFTPQCSVIDDNDLLRIVRKECDNPPKPSELAFRGFPTRMVHLYHMSCLRYTILVGDPRVTNEIFILICAHCVAQTYQHACFGLKSLSQIDSRGLLT